MSSLHGFSFKKVILFVYIPLLLCLFSSFFVNSAFASTQTRKLLDLQNQENHSIKKKTNSTSFTSKNQTKPTSTSSSKNSTKPNSNVTVSSLTKNQTKPLKLSTTSSDSLHKNKTKLTKPTSNVNSTTIKAQLVKKLNSSTSSNTIKKPTNLASKTTKLITSEVKKKLDKPKNQKPKQPSWIYEEEDEDLVSDFRDLPSRFQETLLPDLERFSTSSKVYLTRANNDLTNGFKPLVGKKYAPAIASVVSCVFILIPLILVSLIFNKIKAYFSLQKILIFIQIYLAIYFTILSLSALVTGLEPLRFFYATSQTTYICIQVLQTLGYVLYLLLLLMYFVLVFSTETGLVMKLLGLGQTFVGFAVGLHYYVTVFHRAVLHQPPRSSWKVHAIYATCFFLICLLDRAERRKKAYLEEGGAEGKKS